MTKRDFPLIYPGEILLEDFLKPMQISQYHLAQTVGVPPRRINEIVHGKRGIITDTSLRLGRFFGMEAKFWMNLQTQYDLGWCLTCSDELSGEPFSSSMGSSHDHYILRTAVWENRFLTDASSISRASFVPFRITDEHKLVFIRVHSWVFSWHCGFDLPPPTLSIFGFPA